MIDAEIPYKLQVQRTSPIRTVSHFVRHRKFSQRDHSLNRVAPSQLPWVQARHTSIKNLRESRGSVGTCGQRTPFTAIAYEPRQTRAVKELDDRAEKNFT